MKNKIYNENCLNTMARMPDCYIDLTVTSPPYDDLRIYNGYSFDFESIAKELYRVSNIGGVVVWVVNDATINGSETGTSFKQALYFMECGFKLHDTMIWRKPSFSAVGSLKHRYAPVFEYMFILSKGSPKTFNPIKDRLNKYGGSKLHGTIRQKDGTTKRCTGDKTKIISEFGQRHNVWDIPNVGSNGQIHPATFPEKLVNDHILTWSNKGDLVYDPFAGSGTTPKVAKLNGRNWVASEISDEYCKMIRSRICDNLVSTI